MVPHVYLDEERKTLLQEAFRTSNSWVLGDIYFTGNANEFATRCLTTLQELDPKLALIERLLKTLQPMEGVEGQAVIRGLLAELPALSVAYTTTSIVTMTRQPKPAITGGPALFVSYATEDAELARRLADELALYGHTCQLGRHADKGSAGWLAETAEGLNNAYAVLLLAGEETWQDRWVQLELLAAIDKRKQIVPLLLRDGRLPGFLPQEIRPLRFEERDDDALQALLRRLPKPPSVTSQTRWEEGLSPALLQRADELVYMDRLKMEELRHVAQYTQLGGESQLRRTRGDRLELPTVVARQELFHTRWRRDMEAPTETRRFEDAVPELQAIRRAVLLGEPGAGKTTTLYKLAADLIDAALLDQSALVPLMIRLGLWTDPEEPLEDFLRRSVGVLGAGLDERLRAKRAALLLDGLNEIPAAQQEQKYRQVDDFLARHPDVMSIVSCREGDYPPERALALDRVSVLPLDPVRVYEFVHNYLDRDYGLEAGDNLFWKLAGGDAQQTYGRFANDLGQELETAFPTFWLADTLPDGLEWGYQNWSWERWLHDRGRPASLLLLAQNPYMLFMLLDVYRTYDRSLPDNRGELFDSFVETLLLRERLFGLDKVTQTVLRRPEGLNLLKGLTALAYEMQRRRAADDDAADALTALPPATVARFLDEEQRYQAASANLLTLGEEVRFAHQLLQEYFAARAMREQIFGEEGSLHGLEAVAQQLQAAGIWPSERWWETTNWEEATILLAGLYSDDCSNVVRWVAEANPEVAARCMVESGARTPEETKLAMRALWLPRLADMDNDPDPRARAAVGRALGLITLVDEEPLDNRPGVGVILHDGVRIPDIAWGKPVPDGTYRIGGDPEADSSFEEIQETIDKEYVLARYPVTYAQFQCFVEAPDFADARWWEGMPEETEAFGTIYQLRQLSEQRFKYWNHPREMVSWYQAIAFSRWLSDKLGYEVDLPTEYEWEAAARSPDGRFYPWGNVFDATRANTREGQTLDRTSPVGMYPGGANQELGLYDLSGNVWEWCRNKFADPQESAVDGSGARRVLRGGSWGVNQYLARAAYRNINHPAARFDLDGFRLVVRRPPSQIDR